MYEFELVLDDCLQELSAGKSSLGQCLTRYPKYAAELRPLLETALRLQQGKGGKPSGAVRDRTRGTLAGYIRSHPRDTRHASGFLGSLLRWWLWHWPLSW
jgi:hypothetical protein